VEVETIKQQLMFSFFIQSADPQILLGQKAVQILVPHNGEWTTGRGRSSSVFCVMGKEIRPKYKDFELF